MLSAVIDKACCAAAVKSLLPAFVGVFLILQAGSPCLKAEAQNDSDPTTSAQAPPSHPSKSSPQPKRRRLDCRHAADPHRRPIGCKDEELDWDETLTNAWNGARSKMRALGITPTLSYTGVLQTNAAGGPHQMWSYAGQLVGGLDINLERSLKIQGMSIYVGVSWGTGGNLSGALNTLFPVNSLYAPSYYLGEMYLQQTLLNKRLTLVGGRLGPANTFAVLPVFNNYVNYGINPTPYSLGANDNSFFSPPAGTEWGALTTYDVSPLIQISAGMFNTNVNAANGANHGTDFALQQGNKGALVITQASFFPHQIEKDQGKQGQYSVGFLTDNNPLPSVSGAHVSGGGYWGVFAQGQEMIYQPEGPGSSSGMTVWASWAYNSQPLSSPIPLFWGAGASYEGLIPARKQDIVSAGWIYGGFSDGMPSTGAEQVLEVNYRWQYKRFLVVTPDFQYIWKPGGTNARGQAILGIQATVAF